MINLVDFLKMVEEIYNEKPDYRKGGSGSDGTCDCIGLIIGAIRRAGGSWSGTHGSNYAARYEVNNLHRIAGADELKVGDIVFKAYDPMDDDWDLPSTYSNHLDQNDYYHVGVVTKVNPIEITHCTSPTVRKDYKLGIWLYAGQLKKVEGDKPMEKKLAYIDRPEGTEGDTVNVRTGPGKGYKLIDRIKFGTKVTITKDLGEWVYIESPEMNGYVMSNYIMYINDGDTEDDPDQDGLTDELKTQLSEILLIIEKLGNAIAEIVGRG